MPRKEKMAGSQTQKKAAGRRTNTATAGSQTQKKAVVRPMKKKAADSLSKAVQKLQQVSRAQQRMIDEMGKDLAFDLEQRRTLRIEVGEMRKALRDDREFFNQCIYMNSERIAQLEKAVGSPTQKKEGGWQPDSAEGHKEAGSE